MWSLLTCGKTEPGEPRDAQFHFPILVHFQNLRVYVYKIFMANGVSQAEPSATQTTGSLQNSLTASEGRWDVQSHLSDVCLVLGR